MNAEPMTVPVRERSDFLSSATPRWCPGCGCFAVLKSLTATYARLGLPRENLVTLSGIGCTSRMPYYTRTYGFHTLHGRAPTVAIGAKLANPALSVWLISGDGDALAIGGNHTLHLLRRNPDINMLLLNNQIYGLTKGQASPTSPLGMKTRSTPFGVADAPINPINLALAAGATFVARVPDTNGAMMEEVFAAAHAHRGVSFVEVLLNCITFHAGAYALITGKETRDDHSVRLMPGEPMVYGRDQRRVLVSDNGRIAALTLAEGETIPDQALRHDPQADDAGLAQQLALMSPPEMPCALGIFRQVQAPVYGEESRPPG
jgi:2-oxoglutarate/2-oxoacid ferredoxin oxidoreductase subunit beta